MHVPVSLLPSRNASVHDGDLILKTLNNRSNAIAWPRCELHTGRMIDLAHPDLDCWRLKTAKK